MFALIASRGPFAPTPLGCALIPVILFGPVVLILIGARSLLGASPLRWWLLTLLVGGTSVLACFIWPIPFNTTRRGLDDVWLATAWVAVLLTPAAIVREVMKRRR
jgi:hypothetical protein